MKPAEIEHHTSTETSACRYWMFGDLKMGSRGPIYTHEWNIFGFWNNEMIDFCPKTYILQSPVCLHFTRMQFKYTDSSNRVPHKLLYLPVWKIVSSTVKKERMNRSNSLDGEGWNSFPNSRSWYWPRYQSLCSKWIEIINLEQGRSNKSIIPDYNYRLIIFHNGNYCSITVY